MQHCRCTKEQYFYTSMKLSAALHRTVDEYSSISKNKLARFIKFYQHLVHQYISKLRLRLDEKENINHWQSRDLLWSDHVTKKWESDSCQAWRYFNFVFTERHLQISKEKCINTELTSYRFTQIMNSIYDHALPKLWSRS